MFFFSNIQSCPYAISCTQCGFYLECGIGITGILQGIQRQRNSQMNRLSNLLCGAIFLEPLKKKWQCIWLLRIPWKLSWSFKKFLKPLKTAEKFDDHYISARPPETSISACSLKSAKFYRSDLAKILPSNHFFVLLVIFVSYLKNC